jgi:hypothetical protein
MSGPQRWFWLARYTGAAAGIVSAPIAVAGGRLLLLAGCAVSAATLLGVAVGRLLVRAGRPPRRSWAVAGGVVVALGSHPLLVLLLTAVLVLAGAISPGLADFGTLVLISYAWLGVVTAGAGAWAGSAAWSRLTAAVVSPAVP